MLSYVLYCICLHITIYNTLFFDSSSHTLPFLFAFLPFRLSRYVHTHRLDMVAFFHISMTVTGSSYNPSLDLLLRAVSSGFNEQYRKWRRGPDEAPATAATRAPRGAASVPLPRTPKENILSKTRHNKICRVSSKRNMYEHLRVAVKAFAVVWQLK
jgi:hypothetical protein